MTDNVHPTLDEWRDKYMAAEDELTSLRGEIKHLAKTYKTTAELYRKYPHPRDPDSLLPVACSNFVAELEYLIEPERFWDWENQ